jgi:TnpA family transposase
MKSDDYKLPKQQQTLSSLLPKDIRENIQAALLSSEQLKELSPEERFNYKQTQKKLAKVLRELGKVEAENRKLHNYLSQAETQN